MHFVCVIASVVEVVIFISINKTSICFISQGKCTMCMLQFRFLGLCKKNWLWV